MTSLIPHLSTRARVFESSKIREIAEMGMKQEDVLPLWFGEGAWPTHPDIVEAAVTALRNGNHLYQPNNGAPSLREEIARYNNNLFGTHLTSTQITVTPSGMQGLALTAQLLVSPGDKVVTLEPGWPNITEVFKAQGGVMHSIGLDVEQGRWSLDMDKLIATLGDDTRIIIINSPNNPTGWTMDQSQQLRLLEHCRAHNTWIVADDVYARLYRHGDVAPSFLTITEPNDLLISVNSFSKSWSMTGWRLGWMVTPPSLETKLGQLIEFNTSCTAGFIQEAGIAALRDDAGQVDDLRQKIQQGYAITKQWLNGFDSVEFVEPDGAFYCFFSVEGLTDSFAAAQQILSQTKVGLAPGIAFGNQGEGYLRLCYAKPEAELDRAFIQLKPFLDR